MLLIVPTPVWNLGDITVRGLDLLKNTTHIICETTASCIKLLQHYQINHKEKKLLHLSSFTSPWQLGWFLELCSKQDVVLVSDAWTPWLSDPAKSLTKWCREANIWFEVLPWATALIPAVVSTFDDTTHFEFLWFLPQKKGRQTILKSFKDIDHAIFFYESVHRVEKLLKELVVLEFAGTVHIHRELSKRFEQKIHGSASELLQAITDKKIALKWEFVIWITRHQHPLLSNIIPHAD